MLGQRWETLLEGVQRKRQVRRQDCLGHRYVDAEHLYDCGVMLADISCTLGGDSGIGEQSLKKMEKQITDTQPCQDGRLLICLQEKEPMSQSSTSPKRRKSEAILFSAALYNDSCHRLCKAHKKSRKPLRQTQHAKAENASFNLPISWSQPSVRRWWRDISRNLDILRSW
jgi:hypothetical protein